MQTYQQIIDRLTESQRIRLLTNFNSLSDPVLISLGVPTLTPKTLTSIMNGLLPTPSALARTWDRELVSEVTASVCQTAACADARTTCLIAPSAKAAVGCVDDSLSEDPLIAGDMASAILEGIHAAGVNAYMDGYGTHRGGRRNAATWAAHPGETLSARVVDEHLNIPFAAALESPSVGFVAEAEITVPDELREMSGVRILRRRATDEDTIHALVRGEILMEGSAVALQSAVHTYRRLQKDLKRGKATMEESNAAIAAGEAISEATVNAALERLFTFADACNQLHKAEGEPTDIVALNDRAFSAMTVLLENANGLLPLKKKKTKFCMIGAPAEFCLDDPALAELYTSRKFTCTGYAQGYIPALDRSDELLAPAVELARKADMTLLFLSARGKEGTSGGELPANRIALFDQLSRLKKKLIVILDAESVPDIRWLCYAAIPPEAILLAPLHLEGERDGIPGNVGVAYTVEMLFGLRSPAGRLTTTLVDPSDPAAVRGRLPDGPFLGYRYYDTVGTGARYAFGHGLSYTKFKYSKLSVSNGQVAFTVTNKGKRTGVAIPQLYIGKQDSTVLRPLKELIGYEKLELAPGQSQVVTMPLAPCPVSTPQGMKYEAGDYTVSIGESISNICLVHHVRFSGEDLPSDDLSASDYLPTVSNIFTDHYTLEAEYTPMKASLRNPLFGIVALILAASIEVIGMIAGVKSIYLDVIAAVMAVGAIVFLLMEMVDRKRQFAREQQRLKEINDILFADARKISAPTADELFAETPDGYRDEEEEIEAHTDTLTGEYDHFADVDSTLTFAAAADELRKLAEEKGVELDAATANSIFAAFASTRLIVLRNMDNDRFHALLFVLCEYFGCPVCLDHVNDSYVSESVAVLGQDSSSAQSGLLTAIYSAQDRVRNMQIAALTDVSWSNISNYFVPFAAYARAPFSACHLSVNDHSGRAMSYHLAQNLWFILNLKDGESLGDIPEYIADVATVHSWNVGITTPSSNISEFRSFYYGQMLYLAERTQSSFVMDEDVWKKLDRLESFVGRYGDFRIGNKLWLGMETYLAVLTAASVEVPAALDETLSVKLLPTVIRTLAGKIARDAQGLGEALDLFLGEDCTTMCRKTIKESGADIM